jgi:hypothetical protein
VPWRPHSNNQLYQIGDFEINLGGFISNQKILVKAKF